MTPFKKIGLTGGIGAGKSEAAQLFSREGIRVIDLDKVGRELITSDPSVKNEIVTLFGQEILKQGEIDRTKLREIVFFNPDKKRRLENIIQPRVRKTFESICEDWKMAGHKLIICEAALLIESGYRQTLDELIVVMAPKELRLKRIQKRDNIGPELAEQMLNSQVSDSERLKAATYILKNENDIPELTHQVSQLVQKWKKDGLLY